MQKDNETIKQIIELYKNNYTMKQIAEKLKINRKTVSRYLKQNDIKTKSKYADKEQEILEEFKKNPNYLSVSKKFSLSPTTIKKIVNKNDLYSDIGVYGNKQHNVDEDYFKVIDTEEKAYWLGFIAADGCVYECGNSKRFQINLSTVDLEHLKKLKESLKTDYEITFSRNDEICTLTICNKNFSENLIKQNIIPRKSLVFEPPEIREDLIHHFIRGYFDGDGCIYYYEDRNSFEFSIVGGQTFADYANEKIEAKTNIYIKQDKYYYVRCTKKEEIYNIYKYLYEDATIYLERKYNKFKKLESQLTEM